MAVLEVPFHSPWFFSRWAFGMLLERSVERLEGDPDDIFLLRQAKALDGLVTNSLEPDVAARLMRAVGTAAAELREELGAKGDADQRDRELADLLAEVSMILRSTE
jgi:hypothetical protein